MALAATALLLSLVLAQSSATGGFADDIRTTQPDPQNSPEDEIAGPPGVPFVPSVGATPAASQGVFLDFALLSEARAATLAVTDAGTTWGEQVDVTPGIALEATGANFSLSMGYAPRLTFPLDVGAFELAVLHRATARADWRPSPTWTLGASGVFIVGDYSQLNPASTPGGTGPTPPVLNPVRTFLTYPYVGIDTLLRVDAVLSSRTRIRVAGGYFDVGGTGPVGEVNQPRAWGPQGEIAFAWDASRTATLTTLVQGQNWLMSGSEHLLLTTITEGWTQAWTADLDTTIAAGIGYANRDVETYAAAGHLVPVARLSLAYRLVSRQRVTLTLDAALSPYFDTYTRTPYQRVTFGAALDWRPSDAWQVGASLTAALAPYTSRAPESYGNAGLSASFAPVEFLILTAGGFTLAQFQGASTIDGTFRQWTGYLSVTLRAKAPL